MPVTSPPIEYDLDPCERELVRQVAESHFKSQKRRRTYRVELRPHTRVHRSETKIFRVRFIRQRPSKYFIMKITRRDLVKREYSRWQSYVKDCLDAEMDPPVYGDRKAAILYKHVSGSTEYDFRNSQELKDILFDSRKELKTRLAIISGLYKLEMAIWNEGAEAIKEPRKRRSLLHEYTNRQDYLRHRDSDNRIKSFLGKDWNNRAPSLFGRSIINPIIFLNQHGGFRREIYFKRKCVHGDLHPRNVILDVNKRPHLVDFEWTHVGHAIKDHVLLECSLKFFQMPRDLNPAKVFALEDNLINFRRYSALRSCFWGKRDTPLREAYRLISRIRESAREFTLDWQREYLSALFLVTYGLLKYDECHFPYAIYSLGRIGNRLSKLH